MDDTLIAENSILSEQSFDASDANQVMKARQKAGREKKAYLRYLRDSILMSAEGRKFMYRLLVACEPFRLSYMASEASDGGTSFRDGKKFIGFQLMADLKAADRKLFYKMCEEGEEANLPSLFPTDGLI